MSIKKIKNKSGRKIGQRAIKDKFLIQYYNKSLNTWDTLGVYPSLKKASEELNLSYGMLSDINIGRRKLYNKFYKVSDIRKIETEPPEPEKEEIKEPDLTLLMS
jgi:hypothetical protein